MLGARCRVAGQVMGPLTDALKNDTLDGLLFAHERPEEKHLRRKLGYWRMVEVRMIRAQIAAEAITDPLEVQFETVRRLANNHANDISFRESSRRHSPRDVLEPRERFTRKELQFLALHFAGANDPVAYSILVKALAFLDSDRPAPQGAPGLGS